MKAAGIIDCVKPIRTDFKGYEGKYVGGRVPYADEPIYAGLG